MNRFITHETETKSKKNIIIVSLVVLLLSICVVGMVLAYYNSEKNIDNAMQTATSEMVLNEIFNEKDRWVAGETKQKEVSFENTGEIEQLLRFTVTAVWYDENGDAWTADEDAVTINYTEDLSDDWTYINGYYYYNTTISPNEETNIVMDSVTFSSELDNGGYGSSLDYSGKTYSLTIEMEAIEVNTDVAQDSWNVSCIETNGTLEWKSTT